MLLVGAAVVPPVEARYIMPPMPPIPPMPPMPWSWPAAAISLSSSFGF